MEKVEFFQIPSCKFENIASGVYSHPNSAPHTPLMLTSLKVYIYSFLNSVSSHLWKCDLTFVYAWI